MARKRSSPSTPPAKTTPRRAPAPISPATTQRHSAASKRPGRKPATSKCVPATASTASTSTVHASIDASSMLSSAPVAARPMSKQAQLIGLLRSADGADLAQMIAVTGWQAHSVRGAISGVLRKKLGLTVVSQADAAGIRRYRIEDTAAA